MQESKQYHKANRESILDARKKYQEANRDSRLNAMKQYNHYAHAEENTEAKKASRNRKKKSTESTRGKFLEYKVQ